VSQDVQDRAVVPRSATRPAPTPPLLTRWGVTPEADVVYRALLAYGPQSPATLGRALGMPTSRVRQSLDELADAGAASRSGGPGPAGGDWRAAAPEAVVATLQRHRILAAQARHRLHRQLTGLTELGVPDPRTLPLDSVRPLYGGERIRARLTELCHREHREHL
jgi:hypothetical protein